MLRLLAVASVSLLLVSCDDTTACTEVGCENEAVVTFPAGLITGPYELTLSNGSQMETYICNDQSRAPENPEGVSCDAAGFELVGSVFAARSSVFVTIISETGDALLERREVTLQAVETVQPNGPDCEPTCVVRNGRVQ
ncbi:MAG: hypothetical protein AAGA54_16930 [Myxococcota bacterium]